MQTDSNSFSSLSHAITAVRFPLVVAIILLHAYTATELVNNHVALFRSLYPFALWFGETGVPTFFFISGLLFFHSTKTYAEKLKIRVKTLLVPYVFWNGLYILAYVGLFLCGHEQPIFGRSLASYDLIDYLRLFWDRGYWDGGNGTPLLCPFWYIRDLMVVSLLSPAIYYIIRATGILLPLLGCALWFATPSVAFSMQCLAMFSLGAYFSIKGINLLDLLARHKASFLACFAVLALADWLTHLVWPVSLSLLIHRLSLVINVAFMLWLGQRLYTSFPLSKRLSHAAFFVFCIHYPLNAVIRRAVCLHPEWPVTIHIALYWLSVVLVVAICLALYQIAKSAPPDGSRLLLATVTNTSQRRCPLADTL